MSTLVIGYGNDLRGDDAVGQRVAQSLARWRHPGVVAIVAHQLTPELSTCLVRASLAIFVDAARAENDSPIFRSRRIEPSDMPLIDGHTGDPQALLALTQHAYGRCPPAWWVTIPAHCFDFGTDLSPAARRGTAAALRHIRALIRAEGTRNA